MMKIYYDRDADLQQITNKKVAVIGFGSQGHAHALNMKEKAAVSVVVGLREGSSWRKAEQSGLKVMPVADAVKASDVVMILAPDEAQAALYRQEVAPNLKPGYCTFGHGFNIHFGQIVAPPTINVFMVAPKGPGIWYDLSIPRAAESLSLGGASRSQRHHQAGGSGLCECHRRRARRRHRNQFSRRNRDGPVRRTSGPLRRSDFADTGRL